MLRGINVSGQKKVLMDDLRELFKTLGYRNVQTYIQSGNVVFESDSPSAGDSAGRIASAIEEEWNFTVPVVIRTSGELNQVIRNNPFVDKSPDHSKLLVSFLSSAPETPIGESALGSYAGPDEFHLEYRELYLHCPGGYGKTKLSNTYIEKTLAVTATTRNWKTVLKLADMAG